MQRRTVQEVLADLRHWRSGSSLTYAEIAERCDIDVSSVYRIFEEGRTRSNYGRALRAICKLANVDWDRAVGPGDEHPDGRGRAMPEAIRRAVMHTWDGTDEHASRLAAAITAIGGLVRQARPSR